MKSVKSLELGSTKGSPVNESRLLDELLDHLDGKKFGPNFNGCDRDISNWSNGLAYQLAVKGISVHTTVNFDADFVNIISQIPYLMDFFDEILAKGQYSIIDILQLYWNISVDENRTDYAIEWIKIAIDAMLYNLTQISSKPGD